jgi:hypothetical protein
MPIRPAILFSAILIVPAAAFALQAAKPAATAPTAPAQATQSAPTPPQPKLTAQLQRDLDSVKDTIAAIKTDKWKKGSVRDEADANINSIQRDLAENMPPLLAASEAAPSSVSKALPLSRHLDALYDVLLRIYEAARVSAPPDQIAQIQQTMSSLDKARRALNDRIQDAASSQEKRAGDLQNQLSQAIAHPLVAAAAPAPCPTTPAKKPAARKKPKPPATSTTTPPATQPTTPPKQ